MTKILSLLVSIIIVGYMLFGMVVADAPIGISSFVNFEGKGIIDRNVLFQTNSGFEGQKYEVEIYTPSLGFHGLSILNFSEEINMVLDNESVIDVVGDGAILNTKTSIAIKNYPMGVMLSHQIDGDFNMAYEYLANNQTTFQFLDGKISGKGEIYNLIKYPINKTYIIKDKTQFEGDLKIGSEMEVWKIAYPASDIGFDWLGCP